MAIVTYVSIITLHLNGLNVITKRHRLAEWIQKQDPYMCCLQETHFRPKDTYRLKVKVWMEKYILDIQMEKYIPCTWKAKESWSSNLHTRQNDFKIKNITRDKKKVYKL